MSQTKKNTYISLKLANIKRLLISTTKWIIKTYEGHTWVNTVGNNIWLLFKTGIQFTKNDSYSAGSVNQHKMSMGKMEMDEWLISCFDLLFSYSTIFTYLETYAIQQKRNNLHNTPFYPFFFILFSFQRRRSLWNPAGYLNITYNSFIA